MAMDFYSQKDWVKQAKDLAWSYADKYVSDSKYRGQVNDYAKSYWNGSGKKPSATASRASASATVRSLSRTRPRRSMIKKKFIRKTHRSRGKRSGQSLARTVLNALQAPQRYYSTQAYAQSNPQGQQAVIQIPFFNNPDLTDIFTHTIENTSGAPIPNSSLLFEKCRGKMEITNSSSQPVMGCVYEFKPRRDCSSDPLTLWRDTTGGMPSVQGNPYMHISDYGATPFMSPLLTAFYKIKTWGFHLNSGEQREWNVGLRSGRFQQVLLEEGDIAFRGWTKYYAIVAWGSSVHDSTTNTLVTTAPIHLDMVANESYEYRNFVVTPPYMYTSQGLDTVTVPISYKNTGDPVTATAA